MIKVVFITSGFTKLGGVAKTLSNRVNALARFDGYQLFVLGTAEQGVKPYYELDSKVTYKSISSSINSIGTYLSFRKKLKAELECIQPNYIVVSDNGIKSFFLTNLYTSATWFYELHVAPHVFPNFMTSRLLIFSNSMRKYFIKNRLSKFDKIIFLQQAAVYDFLPKEKVAVIPNFIKPFTNSCNFEKNHDKIIVVGRIIADKRYDWIIEIWKKVIEKYPTLHLHIYGSWIDEQVVQSLQQQENIVVHHPTKDLDKIYKDAKVLINASSDESFSMICLEAMKYNTAVISTKMKYVDWVEDEKNALLFESTDEAVEQLSKLIENKSLYLNLIEEGQKTVQEFSEENIIKQWRSLFEN